MPLMMSHILDWLQSNAEIPEGDVSGVSIDTRTLAPGDLFAALKGGHADGHRFVRQALKKGASAALVSRSYINANENLNIRGRLIGVDDPLTALQNLAARRRAELTVPVIAVTGTNGKTTTKEMIAAVLNAVYRVHKTEGNLNNHIGLPLTILRCPDSVEIMVLEMGMNHPGEIRRLCEIACPTHGVITNVGRGHLGFFESVEAIGRAKAELLESLRNGGKAFINGDDPILLGYRKTVSDTILFGFGESCQVRAENRTRSADRPAMRIHETELALNVPGAHQLYNALAAVAVALDMDIPSDRMASALSAFRSCERRMEKIEAGRIQIFNDAYNANPDSMMAALKTVCGLSGGRCIAILGDMLELGDYSAEAHAELGRQMRSMNIDRFVGIGPEMEKAVQSFNENGSARGSHFRNLPDFLPELGGLIKAGDVVLVKGSRGMHMENIVDYLVKQIETGE